MCCPTHTSPTPTLALPPPLTSGVFSWLVGRINARLDSGKRASGATIAILDIYGFEQFDNNR